MKLLPLILLIALPAAAKAQFNFTSDNGTITITGYTDSNAVVRIPTAIAGLPVTSIGDWAFYATSVKNVLIPDSVTNVGNGVFFDCESLTNATLGNSVASIGDWAFGFCPSLVSLCCRGNPPALGGGNVFYGNAATIYYLSTATGWAPTFDDHPAVLWNPAILYQYYVTANDDVTITGYWDPNWTFGTSRELTIPNSIDFLPVVTIGGYALAGYGEYLINVAIPDSVTSIEQRAFMTDGLTNIIIPNSVTNIGFWAFYNNPYLNTITISTNMTSIGAGAFAGCAVCSIIIPNGVTNIGGGAFAFCYSLTNVVIPNSVTSIGGQAFAICDNLPSINIPNSVTSIGNDAFDLCGSLVSITIPASVTNISNNVFLGCTGLTSVYFEGNAPQIGSDLFDGDSGLTVYYLPETTGWSTELFGFPTALWLPEMQIVAASLGQTIQFNFNIAWASGQTVVVDACTNLFNPNWQPLQTNVLTTGSVYFSDPQWTNYLTRFYRVRSP
jgi:hypothetical protein